MNRRTFLATALGSAAAHFLPLLPEGEGEESEPMVEAPKPQAAKGLLKFGELALLFTDVTNVQVQTPSHVCPWSGYRTISSMSTVSARKLVAPEAVWNAILDAYCDVHKATTNPALVIEINNAPVATFDHVLLQSVGTTVSAQGMVVVEDLCLVAKWRELREAMDKYEEAAKNDPDVRSLRMTP